MFRIGLISDTHGLLRPEAVECLRGSDHILHAGDIGKPDILHALRELAPVTAVRGNNDTGSWADDIRELEYLELAGTGIYVLHDLSRLDLDPEDPGVSVVVAGHSHRPRMETRGGVIYVNPGSAGPRRFKLPVSVAELVIDGDVITPRILELEI